MFKKSKFFLNKKIKFVFILLLLLVSFRTDYRYINEINCCGDDHSYYVHTETIAEDFDFDYSNQIEIVDGKVYVYKEKIAPLGFVGAGILAAPFMFIGNILDNIFSNLGFIKQNNMNYKILLYSFSPIFYFAFSYYLFVKIIKELDIKINLNWVLLIFFGTGVHYYAFERYSMTHIYEFFTATLIIYFMSNFYRKSSSKENIIAGIIPYLFLISYLVRYVNYFVFLIPFWINKVNKKKMGNRRLIKNKYFIINSFFASLIFMYLSNLIYGQVSFRPLLAYNKQTFPLISETFTSPDIFGGENVFIYYFKNLVQIFITQEFGIIWFIPIIFLILIFLTKGLLLDFKNNYFKNLVVLTSMGSLIFLVLIWRTIASAFGMRYLYSLIPLCLYLFINYFHKITKIEKIYLIIFSIFSLLSVLFFETNVSTSLSEIDQVNSFGKLTRYAQPLYFSGVLGSLFSFDSYQIIFATSLFGGALLKILFVIFSKDQILYSLEGIGLNISNGDVINLFNNINNIEFHKYMIAVVLISIVARIFSYEFKTNKL